MPNSGIAKLFRNGGSQAVRLPREFRFEGSQVRVPRLAEGVLSWNRHCRTRGVVCGTGRVRQARFLGKSKKPNQSLISNASR
jgi:hypothetical protein